MMRRVLLVLSLGSAACAGPKIRPEVTPAAAELEGMRAAPMHVLETSLDSFEASSEGEAAIGEALRAKGWEHSFEHVTGADAWNARAREDGEHRLADTSGYAAAAAALFVVHTYECLTRERPVKSTETVGTVVNAAGEEVGTLEQTTTGTRTSTSCKVTVWCRIYAGAEKREVYRVGVNGARDIAESVRACLKPLPHR